MSTFVGDCKCGTFDCTSVRVSELIVDGQVKFNATNSFVSVWPSDPNNYEPTTAIDACISYENMCDHWLNRIGCPGDQRQLSGCGHQALGEQEAVCMCGTFDVSSVRINELIIDVSL